MGPLGLLLATVGMAAGLSAAQVKNLLKSMKGTAPTTYAAVWVQLHKGSPGSAGTTNQATETTRKEVKFKEENPLKNEAAAKWTGVSTTEEYTHYSFWSESSGGTFLGYGQLTTPRSVTAGDTVEFAIGALELEGTVAS